MQPSDVEDYMSEKFLVSENLPKRKGGLKKRFVDKPKSPKEMEKERLQEGLNTQLDSTNKGFRMLAKMGFKEGQSLGKNGNSNTALKEPLPLIIKKDRAGIPERPDRSDHFKKAKVEHKDLGSFKEMVSDKQKDRKVVKQIIEITTKTIPHFDEMHEKKERNALLYDFEEVERKRLEGSIKFSFEDFLYRESQDRRFLRLESLLHYLRKNYYYCTHCAFTYGDYETLLAECPGLWEEDH